MKAVMLFVILFSIISMELAAKHLQKTSKRRQEKMSIRSEVLSIFQGAIEQNQFELDLEQKQRILRDRRAALPVLISLLRSDEFFIREFSEQVLYEMDPKDFPVMFKDLLNSSGPDLVMRVTRLLEDRCDRLVPRIKNAVLKILGLEMLQAEFQGWIQRTYPTDALRELSETLQTLWAEHSRSKLTSELKQVEKQIQEVKRKIELLATKTRGKLLSYDATLEGGTFSSLPSKYELYTERIVPNIWAKLQSEIPSLRRDAPFFSFLPSKFYITMKSDMQTKQLSWHISLKGKRGETSVPMGFFDSDTSNPLHYFLPQRCKDFVPVILR